MADTVVRFRGECKNCPCPDRAAMVRTISFQQHVITGLRNTVSALRR